MPLSSRAHAATMPLSSHSWHIEIMLELLLLDSCPTCWYCLDSWPAGRFLKPNKHASGNQPCFPRKQQPHLLVLLGKLGQLALERVLLFFAACQRILHLLHTHGGCEWSMQGACRLTKARRRLGPKQLCPPARAPVAARRRTAAACWGRSVLQAAKLPIDRASSGSGSRARCASVCPCWARRPSS